MAGREIGADFPALPPKAREAGVPATCHLSVKDRRDGPKAAPAVGEERVLHPPTGYEVGELFQHPALSSSPGRVNRCLGYETVEATRSVASATSFAPAVTPVCTAFSTWAETRSTLALTWFSTEPLRLRLR